MKRCITFLLAALLMLTAAAAFAADNARFGILTGDNVSVRSQPSTESEKLGSLDKGQKLIVTGASGEFYAIRYKGGTGYVSDQFVAIQQGKSNTVNADNVTLRDGPSTDTSKLDSLSEGAEITVYHKEGDFYQVTFGDELGYISERYIGKAESSSKRSKSEQAEQALMDGNAQTQSSAAFADTGKYSQDELLLLARLVDREGDGTQAGDQAVASVLYNRLNNKKFPSNVAEMVFQPNQFSVVDGNDFMTFTPDKRAVSAVESVFIKGDVTLPSDVLYFKSASNTKDWGNRKYVCRVGGNSFYC